MFASGTTLQRHVRGNVYTVVTERRGIETVNHFHQALPAVAVCAVCEELLLYVAFVA